MSDYEIQINNSYAEFERDSDIEEYVISDVFVPLSDRRKGIGTKLVKDLIVKIKTMQQARQEEEWAITLFVNSTDDSVDQEDLISFYSSIGFKETDGNGNMRYA